VADAVGRVGIAVVLPIAEPSLLALSQHRAALGDAVLPFPALEITQQVLDKQLVLSAARDLGIAVPAQVVLHTRNDVAAMLRDPPAMPVVLKPSRSVGQDAAGRHKLSVRHVAQFERLAEEIARLPDAAFPLLVQQRIVGPGVGVFVLRWDGRTELRAGHERILEKPPSGGVSVYRRSVVPDAMLASQSDLLLDRLGWQGVAMIEYKQDRLTGTPYLMEINGRFWGSLQLAIDAGADFPAHLVALALGRTPPVTIPFRRGVALRWEWGCVDHLLARLRRSAAELSLPDDASSLLASAARVLLPWRPDERWEVFRLTDPRPFLRETRQWFATR
jgi:predicted ATP-grasp superfamily ATP-dependent carboligase